MAQHIIARALYSTAHMRWLCKHCKHRSCHAVVLTRRNVTNVYRKLRETFGTAGVSHLPLEKDDPL